MLFKSLLSELWIPPVPVAGISQAVQKRGGAVLLEGKGKLPWDVTAVTECRSQAVKGGWADSDHEQVIEEGRDTTADSGVKNNMQ